MKYGETFYGRYNEYPQLMFYKNIHTFRLKTVSYLESCLRSLHSTYSQTTMARTPIARLPCVIRTSY